MTVAVLYLGLGAVVFCSGLFGVFAARHAVRRILAANLAGAGVFMTLIALAARGPGGEPDPVPHSMVLTGLVVAVGSTALALALVIRLERLPPGDVDPPDPEVG